MNPVSIIILLLIIAYCAFVIYKQVQKKKQGGCGGNCAGCSGCSSFQVNDSSVKKKRKVISNGGSSTGSMFYAFAIFIGLYLIGVIGYQLYKLIRKLLNK